MRKLNVTGRGAKSNPANRFETIRLESVCEQSEPDGSDSGTKLDTEYVFDDSRSVISENDSPDIRFRYSLNPYRGCAHGCSYCYARNYHEYLGWSAGLDFETKLLVKRDAPQRFREWLNRTTWVCEPIALSGATDCYQPAGA